MVVVAWEAVWRGGDGWLSLVCGVGYDAWVRTFLILAGAA